MKTINIEVEGMSCGGCVSKISNHLSENQRISDVKVSLENKTVIIEGEDDLSNMAIRNEIIDLGFTVKSIKKV